LCHALRCELNGKAHRTCVAAVGEPLGIAVVGNVGQAAGEEFEGLGHVAPGDIVADAVVGAAAEAEKLGLSFADVEIGGRVFGGIRCRPTRRGDAASFSL
jgi:hypothetical protein